MLSCCKPLPIYAFTPYSWSPPESLSPAGIALRGSNLESSSRHLFHIPPNDCVVSFSFVPPPSPSKHPPSPLAQPVVRLCCACGARGCQAAPQHGSVSGCTSCQDHKVYKARAQANSRRTCAHVHTHPSPCTKCMNV